MKISVVSFDGDMTLWDFLQVMRHSLQKTLDELQKQLKTQEVSDLTIEEMINIRNHYADEVQGKIWNLEEIRRGAFERTLQYVGHPDKNLASHLNTIYLKHRFEDIELYPDVIPTFDRLTQHYSLGLLSNGNTYPNRCGLEDYFDFVVFSQDIEVEKPDVRFFEIAAQKCNLDLTKILHVGDSLVNDVYGAKNAGCYTVWLNRNGEKNNTEIQPDFEVTTLTEILPILAL
ncbi:HAD family hydrolase [Candidatus Poribacteria bacterium]|nr:HAD family hydrolase [Candidatus Poribacteria bacterium]